MAAFVSVSEKHVDHINGVRTDNRLVNLEYVSQRENNERSGSRIEKSSKYRGVSFDKERGKWVAAIYIKGKRKFLGRFRHEKRAAKAYEYEHERIDNENQTEVK
jgi:hypothetical protein